MCYVTFPNINFMIGVIADYGLTLGDLIGVLYQFFKKLGIEQLRFKADTTNSHSLMRWHLPYLLVAMYRVKIAGGVCGV